MTPSGRPPTPAARCAPLPDELHTTAGRFAKGSAGRHRGSRASWSTDLLTATGRARLIARRDRGLIPLARELLLGPEAWGRGAPAEVQIEDPDLLWEIVEARTRLAGP